jgi:hypothetical protein
MMKPGIKVKVVGVSVELSEEETNDLDYWFAHRGPGNVSDQAKCQRGYQVMIDMLKLYREGFHKDGD